MSAVTGVLLVGTRLPSTEASPCPQSQLFSTDGAETPPFGAARSSLYPLLEAMLLFWGFASVAKEACACARAPSPKLKKTCWKRVLPNVQSRLSRPCRWIQKALLSCHDQT